MQLTRFKKLGLHLGVSFRNFSLGATRVGKLQVGSKKKTCHIQVSIATFEQYGLIRMQVGKSLRGLDGMG